MTHSRFFAAVLVGLLSVFCRAALPLDQRPAKPDEWGYRPAEGASVPLNPPSFTWIAPANAATYAVQWSTDRTFPVAATTTVERVAWPTYTHSEAVAPGTYFWRYRAVTAKGEVRLENMMFFLKTERPRGKGK